MATPTSSGNLTTIGSVTQRKPPTDTLVQMGIFGTYGTVTFVFEGTLDGTNWTGLVATDHATGTAVTSTVSPADNLVNVYDIPAGGLSAVRLRTTAVGTGSISVYSQSGSYIGQPPVAAVVAGTAGATTLSGNLTLGAGNNLILDSATGTKIGTATTQKLALYNSTPIVQPANTVDYLAALVNLGLRASGGTAAAAFPGVISSSSASGGIGYATGAGGTGTQGTNRTTTVVMSPNPCLSGSITLFSAAGQSTPQSFTVTNSAVAATDTIILNQKSGTDLYSLFVTNVGTGSFKITFFNSSGTTTETPVFNFAVLKAVAA